MVIDASEEKSDPPARGALPCSTGEEVLARRIRRNELDTIQVLKAMADAQIEYARAAGAGSGQLAYAQKFASSPGKKNGLYWPVIDGEPMSPLGPLVAQAATEGYTTANLTPYHGYLFRILTGQGSSAPGGTFDYVAKGVMIGGFAMVAYPASYGVSGVMTFLISHDGVLYQKDLGRGTAQLAPKMARFDPGPAFSRAQQGIRRRRRRDHPDAQDPPAVCRGEIRRHCRRLL